MPHPAFDDLDLVLKTMATTIVDNAHYFADLDSVVGDGDFGFSLRNGFEVVAAEYDTFDHSSVGSVLKKIGLVISGKVGGVSGPIWGTAFLRAGVKAGDKTEISTDDIIAMLRASVRDSAFRGVNDAVGGGIDRGAGRAGEVERFLTSAMTATNRAAALTHRLLAFSRRQPLDPKPLRANQLVSQMEDLLRRTNTIAMRVTDKPAAP